MSERNSKRSKWWRLAMASVNRRIWISTASVTGFVWLSGQSIFSHLALFHFRFAWNWFTTFVLFLREMKWLRIYMTMLWYGFFFVGRYNVWVWLPCFFCDRWSTRYLEKQSKEKLFSQWFYYSTIQVLEYRQLFRGTINLILCANHRLKRVRMKDWERVTD